MSEKARIGRAVTDAATALKRMLANDNPTNLQSSWETFVIAWRRGFELTEIHLRRRGQTDKADRWFAACRSDATFRYVWEAGNAERHDPEGSSDAEAGGLALNALDPSMPLHVRDLRIENGRVTHADFSNGRWDVVEGRFTLRNVRMRNGRDVVPAPPDPVQSVASKALRFLEDYAREIEG